MAEEAGQVNTYTCRECKGVIVTKNRDDGTTPFGVACRAKIGCLGTMYSALYRVDQNLIPTHQWYRPKSASEKKKIDNPATLQHVEMGGLLLRSLAH